MIKIHSIPEYKMLHVHVCIVEREKNYQIISHTILFKIDKKIVFKVSIFQILYFLFIETPVCVWVGVFLCVFLLKFSIWMHYIE